MVPIVPISAIGGDRVLPRLTELLPTLPEGQWYILPEIYQDADSQSILNTLSLCAREFDHGYLAGLTLPGVHLPGGDPVLRYRVGVLVTPSGVSYGVSGKNSEPCGDVAAYDRWWRVPMITGDGLETVMVLLGSDVLYLLSGVQPSGQYLADWLVVLAHASGGSAQATAAILELAVEAGWVRHTALLHAATAGGEGWTAVDWSPSPEPPFDAAEGRCLSLLRRYAAWLPDEYFAADASRLKEWTQAPPGGRIAVPFSASDKVPVVSDWPFGPVVFSFSA